MSNNYIVSEEELRQLITDSGGAYTEYDKDDIKEMLEDFLKSKQPVELVASGEVETISNYDSHGWIKFSNRPGYKNVARLPIDIDIAKKHDGTNIQIYISKESEGKK
jgi:hypothetical protein